MTNQKNHVTSSKAFKKVKVSRKTNTCKTFTIFHSGNQFNDSLPNGKLAVLNDWIFTVKKLFAEDELSLKCRQFGKLLTQKVLKFVPLRSNNSKDGDGNFIRAAHYLVDSFGNLTEDNITLLQLEFLKVFPLEMFGKCENSRNLTARNCTLFKKRIMRTGAIKDIIIGFLSSRSNQRRKRDPCKTLQYFEKDTQECYNDGYVLISSVLIQLFDISYNQVRIKNILNTGYGIYLHNCTQFKGLEHKALLFGVNLSTYAKNTKYEIINDNGKLDGDQSKGFHGLPYYINSCSVRSDNTFIQGIANVCVETDSRSIINIYDWNTGMCDDKTRIPTTYAYVETTLFNDEEMLWNYDYYICPNSLSKAADKRTAVSDERTAV